MANDDEAMRCIGMMSGTSMDGVDIALIETDGETIMGTGPAATYPYTKAEKRILRSALGKTSGIDEAENTVTAAHVRAVHFFASEYAVEMSSIRLIGFHGHTTYHNPANRITHQIGDGSKLALQTGVDVISDFRSNDVVNGGQGAPFAPVYHAALATNLNGPIAVLNIGGVGNLTWIDKGNSVAFDTGPGNALLDDWCRVHFDCDFDRDGKLSGEGRCDPTAVQKFLAHPYFSRPAPKSLDREDFSDWVRDLIGGLAPKDGAATLCAFTVHSIIVASRLVPQKPSRWLVCGGGRKNGFLMEELRQHLGVPVEAVESVGWDGDALEAQAFGFLAARSLLGKPLSFPTTTGVPRPITGGRLFKK